MLVSKHEYDREWRRAESWKATAREMQARLKNAQAVCRYLRGEVKKMTDDVAWLPHYQEATARWQVESKRWENECHDLRGEVERLGKANALLVCENMQLEAQIKLIKSIDWYSNPCVLSTNDCKHHNMWGDVYDNKRSYRCPDCGLEYDEVTHE